MLWRLSPSMTVSNSPGPRAIRIPDWSFKAVKHLKNRNCALHTDGARTYKLEVEGLLHDHVVHRPRQFQRNGRIVERNGRPVWLKLVYIQTFTHKTCQGKTVKCKGSTQIIDRFWQHLRRFMKYRSYGVGSVQMITRIRAAQWSYWHKDENLWLQTDAMLTRLSKIPSWRVSDIVPDWSDVLGHKCEQQCRPGCASTQDYHQLSWTSMVTFQVSAMVLTTEWTCKCECQSHKMRPAIPDQAWSHSKCQPWWWPQSELVSVSVRASKWNPRAMPEKNQQTQLHPWPHWTWILWWIVGLGAIEACTLLWHCQALWQSCRRTRMIIRWTSSSKWN